MNEPEEPNTDRSIDERAVAFYAASVAAWYTTKFERDKHLLTLSSLGVGLIVTILTTAGVPDKFAAWGFVIAVACFLVCIATVLSIFHRNSVFLQEMLADDSKESDKALEWRDQIALFSFLVGVIATAFFGLSVGFQKL